MAKTTQGGKPSRRNSAILEVVAEEKKTISRWTVVTSMPGFENYNLAALAAKKEREIGRMARVVRKVVYYVEEKPRVIH